MNAAAEDCASKGVHFPLWTAAGVEWFLHVLCAADFTQGRSASVSGRPSCVIIKTLSVLPSWSVFDFAAECRTANNRSTSCEKGKKKSKAGEKMLAKVCQMYLRLKWH